MHSLSIQNVKKSYGNVAVLKNINIEAEAGEFLVLLGPSGCGKSTLLNAIAGLETISSGNIVIDGNIVNDLDPKDRDIAMVFQSYALYPSMTVRENICFGLKVRKVPKDEQTRIVNDVADILQLEEMLDRKPSQLSGGQRQRVAMGRALVRSPKIFLFDEPLSNLDAKLRVSMRAEIKKLHQRLGRTTVYVTHDQIEAMTLATKVAVMRSGIVQQLASPQELYDQPANLYVAGFIGSPPMNLIPAKLLEMAGRASIVIEKADGTKTVIDYAALNPQIASYINKDIVFGVRPENLHEAKSDTSQDLRKIAVNVELVEPTGADTLALFSLGGAEVTARLRPGIAVAGTELELEFDINKTSIFDAETELLIKQL